MFEVEYKGANNVIFTTKMVKIAFDPALSLVGLKGGRMLRYCQRIDLPQVM